MGTPVRRSLLVGLAGAGVLAVGALAAGAFVLHGRSSGSAVGVAPVPADPALDTPNLPLVLVHVSGAVVHPGLYRLSPSARVAEAIAAAGGLSDAADQGRLPDLAAKVQDGKQVNVPFATATRPVTGSGGRVSSSGRVPFASRLDVNTAGVDDLRQVPGMPIGLPEAIVDARTTFGPFPSLSQMKTVLGLDGPTFNAVRPFLRAGTSPR